MLHPCLQGLMPRHPIWCGSGEGDPHQVRSLAAKVDVRKYVWSQNTHHCPSRKIRQNVFSVNTVWGTYIGSRGYANRIDLSSRIANRIALIQTETDCLMMNIESMKKGLELTTTNSNQRAPHSNRNISYNPWRSSRIDT